MSNHLVWIFSLSLMGVTLVMVCSYTRITFFIACHFAFYRLLYSHNRQLILVYIAFAMRAHVVCSLSFAKHSLSMSRWNKCLHFWVIEGNKKCTNFLLLISDSQRVGYGGRHTEGRTLCQKLIYNCVNVLVLKFKKSNIDC